MYSMYLYIVYYIRVLLWKIFRYSFVIVIHVLVPKARDIIFLRVFSSDVVLLIRTSYHWTQYVFCLQAIEIYTTTFNIFTYISVELNYTLYSSYNQISKREYFFEGSYITGKIRLFFVFYYGIVQSVNTYFTINTSKKYKAILYNRVK